MVALLYCGSRPLVIFGVIMLVSVTGEPTQAQAHFQNRRRRGEMPIDGASLWVISRLCPVMCASQWWMCDERATIKSADDCKQRICPSGLERATTATSLSDGNRVIDLCEFIARCNYLCDAQWFRTELPFKTADHCRHIMCRFSTEPKKEPDVSIKEQSWKSVDTVKNKLVAAAKAAAEQREAQKLSIANRRFPTTRRIHPSKDALKALDELKDDSTEILIEPSTADSAQSIGTFISTRDLARAALKSRRREEVKKEEIRERQRAEEKIASKIVEQAKADREEHERGQLYKKAMKEAKKTADEVDSTTKRIIKVREMLTKHRRRVIAAKADVAAAEEMVFENDYQPNSPKKNPSLQLLPGVDTLNKISVTETRNTHRSTDEHIFSMQHTHILQNIAVPTQSAINPSMLTGKQRIQMRPAQGIFGSGHQTNFPNLPLLQDDWSQQFKHLAIPLTPDPTLEEVKDVRNSHTTAALDRRKERYNRYNELQQLRNARAISAAAISEIETASLSRKDQDLRSYESKECLSESLNKKVDDQRSSLSTHKIDESRIKIRSTAGFTTKNDHDLVRSARKKQDEVVKRTTLASEMEVQLKKSRARLLRAEEDQRRAENAARDAIAATASTCENHADCPKGAFCTAPRWCASRLECTLSRGFPELNPINGICPSIDGHISRITQVQVHLSPSGCIGNIHLESKGRTIFAPEFSQVNDSLSKALIFDIPTGQHLSVIKTRVRSARLVGLQFVTGGSGRKTMSPWLGDSTGQYYNFAASRKGREIWALHRSVGDCGIVLGVDDR